MIVLGNGTLVRASDGKVLCTDSEMGDQSIASPVVEQGQIFQMPTAENGTSRA